MYTEGSQSYLTVAAATGVSDTVKYVVMNPEHPVFSKPLAPGRYTITSWQRPCDGNCSNLDPSTVDAASSYAHTDSRIRRCVNRRGILGGCNGRPLAMR